MYFAGFAKIRDYLWSNLCYALSIFRVDFFVAQLKRGSYVNFKQSFNCSMQLGNSLSSTQLSYINTLEAAVIGANQSTAVDGYNEFTIKCFARNQDKEGTTLIS